MIMCGDWDRTLIISADDGEDDEDNSDDDGMDLVLSGVGGGGLRRPVMLVVGVVVGVSGDLLSAAVMVIWSSADDFLFGVMLLFSLGFLEREYSSNVLTGSSLLL